MNLEEWSGKTVIVETKAPLFGQDSCRVTYKIEAPWKDVNGGVSWMDSDNNIAALNYAIRAGVSDLPLDDRVLYGKVGFFGHLVHVSEIVDIVKEVSNGTGR